MQEVKKSSFTDLERKVLAAIACADHQRGIMERQLESARVTKRDATGGGFYTTIEVADDAERLSRERWKIEDMGQGFAYHPDLPGGASFILWIRDGRVVTLEGYTNGGDWPKDEDSFRVAA